jgi:hypothetical protein
MNNRLRYNIFMPRHRDHGFIFLSTLIILAFLITVAISIASFSMVAYTSSQRALFALSAQAVADAGAQDFIKQMSGDSPLLCDPGGSIDGPDINTASGNQKYTVNYHPEPGIPSGTGCEAEVTATSKRTTGVLVATRKVKLTLRRGTTRTTCSGSPGISFVDRTRKSGTANPIVATIPNTTKVNDLLLVAIHAPSAVSIASEPAGWQKLRDPFTSGSVKSFYYYKIATVADPGATASWSVTGSTSKNYTEETAVFRDIDTTNPVDKVGSPRGFTSSTNLTAESITPGLNNIMLVAIYGFGWKSIVNTLWNNYNNADMPQFAPNGIELVDIAHPSSGLSTKDTNVSSMIADQFLIQTKDTATGDRAVRTNQNGDGSALLVSLRPRDNGTICDPGLGMFNHNLQTETNIIKFGGTNNVVTDVDLYTKSYVGSFNGGGGTDEINGNSLLNIFGMDFSGCSLRGSTSGKIKASTKVYARGKLKDISGCTVDFGAGAELHENDSSVPSENLPTYSRERIIAVARQNGIHSCVSANMPGDDGKFHLKGMYLNGDTKCQLLLDKGEYILDGDTFTGKDLHFQKSDSPNSITIQVASSLTHDPYVLADQQIKADSNLTVTKGGEFGGIFMTQSKGGDGCTSADKSDIDFKRDDLAIDAYAAFFAPLGTQACFKMGGKVISLAVSGTLSINVKSGGLSFYPLPSKAGGTLKWKLKFYQQIPN